MVKVSRGILFFEANPGGAPCNVLALLKKYGRSCGFIGKIGDDLFGKMLTDILDELELIMMD